MTKKRKNYVEINGAKISRLNFSLIISTGIMVTLMIVFSIIFFGRKIKAESLESENTTKKAEQITIDKNSTETITTKADEYEEDTTKEEETLEFDPDDSNSTGNLNSFSIKTSTVNSWVGKNGYIYTQYRVRIKNITQKNIENWGMALHFNTKINIIDSWNGKFEKDDENIKITPTSKTYEIESGEEIEIGVIIETKGYKYLSSYTIHLGEKSKTVRLSFSVNKSTETTTSYNYNETTNIMETTETTTSQNEITSSDNITYEDETTAEDTTTYENESESESETETNTDTFETSKDEIISPEPTEESTTENLEIITSDEPEI